MCRRVRRSRHCLPDLSASPNGPVQFTINGEPDRRYQVLTSANLLNWQDLNTVLATNNLVLFQDDNLAGFRPAVLSGRDAALKKPEAAG